MTTATLTPPTEKGSRDIRLSVAGVWRGDAALDRKIIDAFGPAKFSLAEQDADPDAPRTRVIKDALRVGKWKIGESNGQPILWEVTRDTLDSIAANFNLAASRGIAMNLGKTHGDASGLIHPDDLIAPLDSVAVVGDVLYVAAYVTPEQRKYLCNPARKVSVGVRENWIDGEGNSYPLQLIHLAVTDHPVVTKQGPFRMLSLGKLAMTTKTKKTHKLSLRNGKLILLQEGESASDGGGESAGEVVAEGVNDAGGFEKLVKLINELLPDGVDLPEAVTAENVVGVLELIIETLKGALGKEEPAAPANGGEVIDEPADAMMAANRNGKGFALANEVKQLRQEVASLKADKTNAAKAAWNSKLRTLANALKIDAATVKAWEQKGEKLGYDLALLAPLEALPGAKRIAKSLANASPPEIPDGDGRRTDEEIKASLKARGIDPEKHFPRAVPI